MITKVICKNLYKTHTKDLRVEVILACQLQQNEFKLHSADQPELNKAYSCATPLAWGFFEWQYFLTGWDLMVRYHPIK